MALACVHAPILEACLQIAAGDPQSHFERTAANHRCTHAPTWGAGRSCRSTLAFSARCFVALLQVKCIKAQGTAAQHGFAKQPAEQAAPPPAAEHGPEGGIRRADRFAAALAYQDPEDALADVYKLMADCKQQDVVVVRGSGANAANSNSMSLGSNHMDSRCSASSSDAGCEADGAGVNSSPAGGSGGGGGFRSSGGGSGAGSGGISISSGGSAADGTGVDVISEPAVQRDHELAVQRESAAAAVEQSANEVRCDLASWAVACEFGCM